MLCTNSKENKKYRSSMASINSKEKLFFAYLNVLPKFALHEIKRTSILFIIKCAAQLFYARSQKKKYHLLIKCAAQVYHEQCKNKSTIFINECDAHVYPVRYQKKRYYLHN